MIFIQYQHLLLREIFLTCIFLKYNENHIPSENHSVVKYNLNSKIAAPLCFDYSSLLVLPKV